MCSTGPYMLRRWTHARMPLPCSTSAFNVYITMPLLRPPAVHLCRGFQDDDDDEAEMALLRDLSNEDDWGLEALTTPARSTFDRQQRIGRRSLVDELTAAEEEELEGSGNAFNGSVRWGGTAGTTGIDMEEQEAVLTRYFRPDQVKKLMKEQQEVDESYSVLRVRSRHCARLQWVWPGPCGVRRSNGCETGLQRWLEGGFLYI